jgi:predicted secreted hydrolase
MRTAVTSFVIALAAGGAWAAGPPPSDLDVIRGADKATPFALAIEPRTFSFPEDHGPHPQFRHEWWYVTGNLDSARGERFGFELIFFRFALAPGASTPNGMSAWRTRQVYLAHFAITDVARGEFRFAHRYARDALGLAGAQAQPLRVWLDDWMFGVGADTSGASRTPGPVSSTPRPASSTPRPVSSTPGPVSPATVAPWVLHAQDQGYELTLELQPLNQPVLNGERGLSRKASERGAASYYYSIPRVAVRGKLLRAGVSSDVQGLAWLDREWGSGSLGSKQQGWDWFALQLQDGSAFMFYALRNRDGTRDSHSAGTWVDPAGHVQALSTDQVTIDVSDHWVSPRGGRYPSRWRVRVPAVGLDVEARPVLADQELGTKPRYWEGAVDVRGTREGHDASGRGYVELVGYGE